MPPRPTPSALRACRSSPQGRRPPLGAGHATSRGAELHCQETNCPSATCLSCVCLSIHASRERVQRARQTSGHLPPSRVGEGQGARPGKAPPLPCWEERAPACSGSNARAIVDLAIQAKGRPRVTCSRPAGQLQRGRLEGDPTLLHEAPPIPRPENEGSTTEGGGSKAFSRLTAGPSPTRSF